jgi:hypothetical protein
MWNGWEEGDWYIKCSITNMYVYPKYFAFILQQLGQFKGQEFHFIVEDDNPTFRL